MQVSPNGIHLLELFEGLGGKNARGTFDPYPDSNHVWTVGRGHVLTAPSGTEISDKNFGTSTARQFAIGAMVRLFGAPTATLAQIDDLFHKDVAVRIAELAGAVHIADTTQSQFDAMASFVYNEGIGHFKVSSVRRLHVAGKRDVGPLDMRVLKQFFNSGHGAQNIAEAFVLWSNVGVNFSLGLFRRRVAEAAVYGGMDAAEAHALGDAFVG